MYKYIDRDIGVELQSMAKVYPVITLTGPRQSGKTTVVRAIFPKKPYYNLEDPDTRVIIMEDPRKFLGRHAEHGVIIDEVQNYPELLSYMQGVVDEDRRPGRFIITGSQNFAISTIVSQSLAGRTAILTLYPLSIKELQKNSPEFTLEEYIFKGFYPIVYNHDISPSKVYRDYVQTYLERDLRQLSNVQNLGLFQKFLALCAGRVGQEVNYNSLANLVGVSSNTIKHWITLLQAAYVIVLVQPYFKNFGKRVTKSPRLYFSDVGLACYLLSIYNISQVERDPLYGSLVENLVVMELLKNQVNKGAVGELYFYRDHNQNEVDILINKDGKLLPIEIKSSETFHPRFLKGLKYFNNISEANAACGYVIYAGKEYDSIAGYKVLHYKNTYSILS